MSESITILTLKYTQLRYSLVLIVNVKLHQQMPGWADKDLVPAGEASAGRKLADRLG